MGFESDLKVPTLNCKMSRLSIKPVLIYKIYSYCIDKIEI